MNAAMAHFLGASCRRRDWSSTCSCTARGASSARSRRRFGGLDAVVFTAGIGENQHEVRRRICEDAAWLGLELDGAANERHGPRISTAGSRVSAWVVPTDEETMIARHVARLLG